MEDMLHEMTQMREKLDAQRRSEANERARARCALREDVFKAELREDGTIMCTGYDGSETLRMAGWRGR